MGINMLDMKQSNAEAVLWTLKDLRKATIKELAHSTGLSFATVSNILSDFVKDNQVMLGEMQSGTGGRPSQTYEFNSEFSHILTVSVQIRDGENLILACIGNLYGEIIWETEKYFSKVDLTNLEAIVDLALNAYPSISILAFSLPGVEHEGVILTIDYDDLEGVLFSQHFNEKYKRPVLVENDVNVALFGYSKLINSIAVSVGIYFPRYFNPGAAILVDGKILKGAHGFAGEVRHLPLGIDWATLDYDDPQLVGTAIAKLIKIFGYIINPDHLILYGDFFSEPVKQIIEQALPKHATHDLIPTPVYSKHLESHIITGLMAQAVELYQSPK